MNKKTLFICQGAIIAALYVALTLFISAFNLASGAIQVRISEALCILPVFTPAAIPGLFIGCIISNTVTGCMLLDIIFGSIATLIGAVGSYLLRKTKFLFTLPPVIANAVIVPIVLKSVYGLGDAYWFLVITVGIGEIISVCILGSVLKAALNKNADMIFKNTDN